MDIEDKRNLNILVVEDGRSQREMLSGFLKNEGFTVSEAEEGNEAITLVKKNFFDIVLLDYKMPGMNGIEVLEQIKSINPEIDAIMMTAYGTIETAVKAMKLGAADYITKPIDLEELLILLNRISEHRTLIRENEILREELRERQITTDKIIYQSPVMSEIINLAGRVAKSRTTVLIHGESGTGKELIARLIHTLSPRSHKPLITVNCAALPESLLESELFGHEKGAFTGASQRRIGRFEEAEGGTLFLDEIGDLSPLVQVKLLRFLQEREFQRIGGNLVLHSNVRVISATNQDLEAKVKAGSFRDDLFYRLNVVKIVIPPLRERKEDISLLIDHFLKRFATESGKDIKGIQPKAKDILSKYDFPGNVRELENILERAVVISRGTMISHKDLPFSEESSLGHHRDSVVEGTLKESIEALERMKIQEAMEKSGFHQTKAAGLLGISERMLRYKLKKYDLK
jgi:DNA-binding NtrC family response regulator